MSYLICGKLIVREGRSRDIDIDVLYRATSAAIEQKVSIFFAGNISQSAVFEIVDFSHDERAIPFMLTDSPVQNTSDDLIAPDRFHYKTDKECLKVLRGSFAAIGAILRTVLASDHFSSAIVVFSDADGDTDGYETIDASLNTFVEACVAGFPNCGDVPSLRVVVRP